MSGSSHSANSWQPHPVRFNFRRWSHRPSILQDWGDLQEERKVSWSELFYDLFSVAATTNVTHLLIDNPTATGAGRFLLLYGIFYFVWSSHSILVNRIRFDGLVFDVLNLLHHLAVLGCILGAQNFEWYARFAGSYAILRIISCIYQALIYIYIPRARPLAQLTFISYAIQVGLAWGAACSTMTNFVAIFVVILFMEAAAPVISSFLAPAARLPIHVDHTNERVGLIMMIYLGESIIQFGIVPLDNTALQYAGIGFSATIVFCLHLIYFHISPEQNDHAMRRSKLTGMSFHYLHALLGAAFLTCGSGLRLALNTYVPADAGAGGHRRRTLLEAVAELAAPAGEAAHTAAAGDAILAAGGEVHSPAADGALAHDGDGFVPNNVAWILCAGYAASLFIMMLIRMTHYLHFDKDHPIWVLGRELEKTHYLIGWWTFIAVWPLAAVFIAFGAGATGATGFLGYICAHAIAYNLIETYITHSISSHPRWVDLVADSTHHHSSHMHKSSSQGSLGTASLGAASIELIKPNNPESAVLAADSLVLKDDAMENGDSPDSPAGAGAAGGAKDAGRQVQGVRVGNTRHRHVQRSASSRALRHLFAKKKCSAWVEGQVL